MNNNPPASRRFTLFLLLAFLGIALIASIGGMYYLMFYIFAPSELTIAVFIIGVAALGVGLGWVLKKDPPSSSPAKDN